MPPAWKSNSHGWIVEQDLAGNAPIGQAAPNTSARLGACADRGRVFGFSILVESAAELLRFSNSGHDGDRSGTEREPRTRLLQHYSGSRPGFPNCGLGVLFRIEVFAFSAGRRRLSTFASRTRRSVRDLHDASLRHPALKFFIALGAPLSASGNSITGFH
jgi:hypothetical protein